jgi:chemotaxis protein MotA
MSTQPVNLAAIEPVNANPAAANRGRRASDYGRRRRDYIGPLGLIVAVTGIALGQVLEGGRMADVLQPTAALIVFGGTIGAVILTTPVSMLKSALRRLKDLLFEEEASPESIIEVVAGLAAKARKSGIVALEPDIAQIPHAFLHRGLMLAVDGTSLDNLKEMMELEIKLEISEAEMDAKVLEAAGGYAPTIGILGAVVGLIQVMKHLDNLSQVGAGIAVAFVATIYGVGSANLLFLPLGQKMRLRAWKAARTKHLMLEGIVSISQGLNPRLVRRRLDAFVRRENRLRETGPRPGPPPAGSAPA